jgi:hypothetical protein
MGKVGRIRTYRVMALGNPHARQQPAMSLRPLNAMGRVDGKRGPKSIVVFERYLK